MYAIPPPLKPQLFSNRRDKIPDLGYRVPAHEILSPKKYPAAGGLLRFVSTFRAIRSNYHRNSKALPLNLLERSKLCRCLTLPVDSHLNGSLGRSAILIKITIKLQRYRVWLASFNLIQDLSPPLLSSLCSLLTALPLRNTSSQYRVSSLGALTSFDPLPTRILVPLVNLINVRKLQWLSKCR